MSVHCARRRLAACQKAMFHEQLRAIFEGRFKVNVVTLELTNDCQQQCVIFFVGPESQHHVQRAPVRHEFYPPPFLKERDLFNLSGHHDMINLGPPKQPNRSTDLRECRRRERVAQFTQFLGEQSLDSHAMHGVSFATGGLGEHDRKATRSGQQSDPLARRVPDQLERRR